MKQFATCHTHPRSLDSGSTPLAMAKREVELGGTSLCCTDHGTLAAAQEIFSLAKATKWPDKDKRPKPALIPIVGLEAYFRDDDCPILTKLGIPRTDTVPRGQDKVEWAAKNPHGTFFDYAKYYHMTLHALDYEGYLTMVRLLSKADFRAEQHGSERKALFDWSDIEELASKRITATSSCLVGIVQRHLADNQNTDAARAYFQRMHHLFGERFYVEVFPHVCSHNWVKKVFIETETANGPETLTYKFEKKMRTNQHEDDGIPAEHLADEFDKNPEKAAEKYQILEQFKHYRKWTDLDGGPRRIIGVRKQEGFIQNECTKWSPDGDVQWGANMFVLGMAQKHKVPVLVADDSHFASPEEKIVQDVRLAQQGDWRFWGSYHRQSSEEAFAYFKAKMNIKQEVFEGWVENSLAWADRFKDFKFDTTPSLPTKFYPADSLGHTKKLIEYHGRMPTKGHPEYRKYVHRLGLELDMLHRNKKIDLLPYFHVDEEMCRFYENQGWITGPGRGSAAGLLLTYLLGITHVDPLKHELSMERFMTTDRIKSGKMPDIDQDLPTREPLVGWHTAVLEFEAEDGTHHVVPENMKFETEQGLLTIREALEKGAELKPWWLEKALA